MTAEELVKIRNFTEGLRQVGAGLARSAEKTLADLALADALLHRAGEWLDACEAEILADRKEPHRAPTNDQ